MRRIIVLALLFGAMRLIEPLGRTGGSPDALLTFGFLILAAYAAGELSARAGQPKIIGYLIAGVLAGPTVLGSVTASAALRLSPVSGLAIALIAFLAGAELDLEEVKSRGKALLRLTVVELAVGVVALFGMALALRQWIPFLADTDLQRQILFALLFALIAVMHSPAIVMAILTETRAKGPAARATLAVVLLSEVVVVLLFSLLLGAAQRLLPGTGEPSGGVLLVIWEIAGSVPIGAALGLAVAFALRVVHEDRFVFALLAAMLGQQVAHLLHVEVLLTLLVAGFVAVNLARGDDGDKLRHSMEQAAGPVFVVFFALAGVAIDVPAAVSLGIVVVPMVLVRLLALRFGVQLGARGMDLEPAQRAALWQGLAAQAGVAIGLVGIVAEAYPEAAVSMRALLLAFIAVNGTLGPILFRRGLERAGELTTRSGDTGELPALATGETPAADGQAG
ncbi:MAG: cation:proton antiporter [Gemmatimonadetes bacterium]|nr:cation:proton antiporter [Gemmatimonadota bacterium]MCA9769593.1 cation:proton antiporter [Gemmatimonadota bacterium]HPF61887.1 cation:proton antiporter [Gemmatimonadales bacterium]HRX18594.1 cation:proton antiporter [Gemmatimonadales bacterium]